MECTQHSSMLLQILTSGQVRIAHLDEEAASHPAQTRCAPCCNVKEGACKRRRPCNERGSLHGS